jgi:intermembrane space import and assembly protein 40
MQDCFRQYPEIYGAELSDEAEEAAEGVEAAAAASPEGSPEPLPNNADNEPPVTDHQALREEAPATISGQTNAKLETDNLPGAASVNGQVPSKWEDATAANLEVEKEDKKEESK